MTTEMNSNPQQRELLTPKLHLVAWEITRSCNLFCAHCRGSAAPTTYSGELTTDECFRLVDQILEVGRPIIILTGGEPLVRKEFIDLTRDYTEILFLVFTNGLLIDEDLLVKLKGQRNFVPVISLEGWEEDTDERRGKGVYEHLQQIIERIKSIGLFWSVSLTVTRSNFTSITDYQFIQKLSGLGCKLFFFIEYTPIKEGTEDWLLTDDQRANHEHGYLARDGWCPRVLHDSYHPKHRQGNAQRLD